MPISPVALDAVVLVAVAAAVLALLLLLELLLLPQAASTNAPKLAAPALPAIFRKRLRSTSSRTSRSTIPAGWSVDSSLGGPDMCATPPLVHCGGTIDPRPPVGLIRVITTLRRSLI